LHGFRKKTQRLPRKELEIAIIRMKDYKPDNRLKKKKKIKQK
jgi:phage-related protein